MASSRCLPNSLPSSRSLTGNDSLRRYPGLMFNEEELLMARIPFVAREDLPPEHQGMMDHPSNINRIFGNSPACRKAHHAMARYIRFDCKLDPRLRELAILEV